MVEQQLHSGSKGEDPSVKEKKICSECGGARKIPGTCVCNMEWRGNKIGDDWEDCQCTPEVACPLCGGSGFLSA